MNAPTSRLLTGLLAVGVILGGGALQFAAPPSPFVVEPPPNAAYPDYGTAGNEAARRLRRSPSKMFTFDRASLRDVLRYLADDASIPFIGIPEGDEANRRLVTLTMEASPFVALESVCRDNGIRLKYENGIWNMRTVDEERERRIQEEDDNKLTGVAYKLRYDPVDRVDFAGGTSSAVPAAGTTATAGSSTVSGANLPLQNSQRVFSSTAPKVVNEVRVMLGLAPMAYDNRGNVTGATATSGVTVESTAQNIAQEQGAAIPSRLNPTYVPPQLPQVIYNADTNVLWVVATRQQHKWVTEYLLAVDQPQVLIAIEVKFFETTRDPSKELGLNWAGTMAGGYTVAATGIKVSPAGSMTLNTTGNSANSRGHATTTDPAAVSPLNTLSNSMNGTRATTLSAAAPYSAILTAGDVALSLQAFMSDQKTSMVQYPRVLTVNNREVAITTAENTPVNAGVTSVGSTATAQNVGSLAYQPTGTQINILPKSLGQDEIALTVAITISNILSYKKLNLGTGESDYPVTAQRIYNASLQVASGYTLAVGGLEAVRDQKDNNGIPFLQDIPGVGELFKSKTRTRNKKNLIVFITPTIIPNPKATRGISETPESVTPIRPNDPTPPSFTPDGHIVGGVASIDAAFAWFDYQIKWFKQINRENRTDKETIKQLRSVISSVRMLIQDIAAMRENADPVRKQELDRHEKRAIATLTELNRVLSYAQDNVM